MAFAAGEAADSEVSYDPNRELQGTKENCQGLAFGISMRQGSRPYMEDVTVAQPVPQHENYMVFGCCSVSDVLPLLSHCVFFARFSPCLMVTEEKRRQILQRIIFRKFSPMSSQLIAVILANAFCERSKKRT